MSNPSSAEDRRPRLVPAVERAVRIVDALAAAPGSRSLASLARELSLPKSSVHGLLVTLDALGLARRDERGDYALGARALRWAGEHTRHARLVHAFDEACRSSDALAAETVMLAVLEGTEVTYLACRPGSRALAVNFRVGGRFPAACTSSGKAMLSTLSDEALRRFMPPTLPRLTRHGPATLEALLAQLAGVRACGLAVDDEETAEGMQCFGAPVHAGDHRAAIAAVAVSVIKAGLTPPRRDAVTRAIVRLAADISRALGSDDLTLSSTS